MLYARPEPARLRKRIEAGHAQTKRGPAPALAGVPVFKADPSWPVLPPDWTWGQVIGIFADSQGHVWTSNRSRITEWDAQGKRLQSWDARGPDGNWSTIHESDYWRERGCRFSRTEVRFHGHEAAVVAGGPTINGLRPSDGDARAHFVHAEGLRRRSVE
jgi:hypothetical protein